MNKIKLMKRKFKIIAISITALLIVRVCLSNEKKKDDAIKLNSTKNLIKVNITSTLNSKSIPVNSKVFGVNIGFAFATELDKDSGFVQLLRAMHPATLRFPGGTVGNYYHPNSPVYGFKSNEIMPSLIPLYNQQSKRSENILYNFIRLSKAIGSGAVFCANLLNGTIEETMFVLDELTKNNIPIYGVELGNEFVLLPYREKIFTSADVYTQKVKATADAISAKYPSIKIAVVAGDDVPENENNSRSRFMQEWNQKLSKQSYFDAYVWHYYPGCESCDKNTFFDSISLLNLQQLAPFQTKKLDNASNRFSKLYGKERKLWLTEWNVGNGKFLESTFAQGAFVYEQFLNIIDINTKNNNLIEITNLHHLLGLINPYKGKQASVLSIQNYQATAQYFAFKFLATTLDSTAYRAAEQITCVDKTVKDNFVCNTFYKQTTKTTYLHYINRSGKPIELTINAPINSPINITSVDAKAPYASAGKTGFEKDYPNKLTPIKLRNDVLNTNTISIAPYSFGYISYQAK